MLFQYDAAGLNFVQGPAGSFNQRFSNHSNIAAAAALFKTRRTSLMTSVGLN